MRACGFVVVLVSCASAAPAPVAPVARAPMPPSEPAAPTCGEAAAGLERATVDVRSPEASVWRPMHERCVADAWPDLAIQCFAQMQVDQLGACARLLPDESRTALFAILRGERDTIAVARARLELMQVGVAECDRFVAAVASLLDCESVPLEDRVRLGNETAELWDLPTRGLPASAQQRMADACGASLAKLQVEAQGAGCVR